MIKALVTGGAGFIGSHLVEALVKKGYEVCVLDNLSTGNSKWIHQDVQFYNSGLNDFELLKNICRNKDVVFHLAAMSRSGPSINQANLCLESNVIGTHNLLEACKLNGVKKFIYSASSTCYGNSPPPNKIENAINILNFYGLSKFYGEQECLLYGQTTEMEVISLRYFNVYGTRQPVEGAYALAIGIFLKAKLQNSSITIHGDGQQTRDFIHVNDVVSANIQASTSKFTNKIYNIGSGKNTSILEIANYLNLEYKFGPSRPGDARHTLADISLSIQDLNWKPQISIYEGLNSLLSNFK